MKQEQKASIYLDFQNQGEYLGEAILLEKIKGGYNFILEESHGEKIPEYLTYVYNFERWKVKFLELSDLGKTFLKVGDIREYNIRYLEKIGIASSSIAGEDDDNKDSTLEDKFLSVDGIEIF